MATVDLGYEKKDVAAMDEAHVYNVIKLMRVGLSHVVHAAQVEIWTVRTPSTD